MYMGLWVPCGVDESFICSEGWRCDVSICIFQRSSIAISCHLSCRREAVKEAPVASEVRIKNSAGDDAADDQSRLPLSCIAKKRRGCPLAT
jgi:hypothetical protein